MTSGSGVYIGLLWCRMYCVEWNVLHKIPLSAELASFFSVVYQLSAALQCAAGVLILGPIALALVSPLWVPHVIAKGDSCSCRMQDVVLGPSNLRSKQVHMTI
jgi:hypothetical protein